MTVVDGTAAAVAEAVRSGATSAHDHAAAALARIERAQPLFDAYQVVRRSAVHEAAGIDLRPDRGTLPLAGVPVAVKDCVPVAGEPMRIGSAASDPAPQSADHEVVRRLRAAGAVVVGLTRVPELCIWGSTDSSYGVTRNPWDRDRTPGGSSGGSAAAVSSGTVPIALGADGMGSIRIPAACCGLVGLKPGKGVVPSGLGSNSWYDLAECGPIATTVGDAALMLSVMAGDATYASVGDAARVRVAVSTRAPAAGTPVDEEWAAATRRVADLLRSAGHQVQAATPRYGPRLVPAGLAYWTAGTAVDAAELPNRRLLEKRSRRHAAAGRRLAKAGLPEGVRERWRAHAEELFAEHDVLLTPTLAQPPIRAVKWAARGWVANLWANARYAPFAAPWNLAGWPAMAVPAGLSRAGLPLSVQLVGRPGSESLLLAVAAQVERLQPWQRLAPAS